MSEYRLGFIGFGHMAQVLFEAMDAARLVPKSHVQFIQRDSAKMKRNEQKYGITSTSMERLISTSDLIFLCVRPAQAEEALKEMARCGASKKMIISVLAGVPIPFFQKHLGKEAEVLRIMPNVASAVHQGMTILSFGPTASEDFRSLAKMVLAPLGPCLEIEERLIDAATGMAGSGPGFVFKLIQAMARVGEREGISRDKALFMAAQTFLGAAQLIVKGADPNSLAVQIATPGGTTEAGFQVMEKTEVARHFEQTVEGSIHKARQFSKEYI